MENDPELDRQIMAEADRIQSGIDAPERGGPGRAGSGGCRRAILTVQAGAGGLEAQDWAGMLAAMYTAWADAGERPVEVLDAAHGDRGGTRSATLQIGGESAYETLRGESGVHRLVRMSPFDPSGNRHTSMASVEVLPEAAAREDTGIPEREVRMTAFRASGPGGQAVNRQSTAVRVTHLPTGASAVCRTERSQARNRENAMRVLTARVEDLHRREEERMESARRGEPPNPTWGHRTRSYLLHPREMVKDHRTGRSTGQAQRVLAGWLDPFIRNGGQGE